MSLLYNTIILFINLFFSFFMDKKLLLSLKESIFSISNFHGNKEFFLEEDRVDPFPFYQHSDVDEFLEGSKSGLDKGFDFSNVYFIDGVQRTILLGEVNSFPLFLHISGAAIMRRTSKKVIPFSDPVIQFRLITHPDIVFDSHIPVEHVTPSSDMSYFKHSSRLRRQLERDFFKKCLKVLGGDEVIIYDGPLFYSEGLNKDINVVGVVKRHTSFYLEDRREIYDISVGERSRAFKFTHGKPPASLQVVSFYSRLFKQKDPYYGLVRVEVPSHLIKNKPDIDGFAGFIFSDRFPISFCENQSDKKLYPISVCEKFLSSKLPSINLLSSFLGDVIG